VKAKKDHNQVKAKKDQMVKLVQMDLLDQMEKVKWNP
jgi:hypothetical protein